MKLVPTLHPSFIQRGNWPSLSLLRRDLVKANSESWLPEVRRRPVTYITHPTVEEARPFLKVNDPRPLYLDIETSRKTQEILCCAVAREACSVVCLPWTHPFTEMLRAVLQDPGCRKVAQNIPFDFPRLQDALGCVIEGEWWDTMQAHALLEPDLRHGLAYLGLDYYDGLPWKGDESDSLEEYNCKDVDVTVRAAEAMEHELREAGLTKLFHETTMQVVPIVINAREWGIRVDLKRQAEVRAELEAQRAEALERAHSFTRNVSVLKVRVADMLHEADQLLAQAAPMDVPGQRREMGKLRTRARKLREKANVILHPNLGSVKQLKQLLYDDLALPVQKKKNDAGLWCISTDETALVEIARRTQHPIVGAILDYRSAQSHMTHVRYEEPMLHPTLQPHGTGTGRLSCVEPNVQNIPMRDEIAAKIRSCFVPAKEGWMLTAADYSQIERRIQAVLSKDRVLLEAFEKGEDVHRTTAALGLGFQRGIPVRPEDVTKQERYLFKRAVYLESYGGGWKKLQTELAKDGVYLSVDQAKAVLRVLKQAHPELQAWRDGLLASAKSERFLRNPFGRIRWFLGPAFGDALNYIPQSTAADIVLRAMVEINTRLPMDRAIIVSQIHDEIIVEHDPAIAPWVKATMKKVMEMPIPELGNWWCPVEVKQGYNWSFA